jgi:hypothetical protein
MPVESFVQATVDEGGRGATYMALPHYQLGQQRQPTIEGHPQGGNVHRFLDTEVDVVVAA